MKLPWSQRKTAVQVADVITKKAKAEVSCDEFGNRSNQAKIEPKIDPWAEELKRWRKALPDLQAGWEVERDDLIRLLPHQEPFRIQQDSDGWWRVLKRVLRVDGHSPKQLDEIYRKKISLYGSRVIGFDDAETRFPPPNALDATVEVRWDYELFDPKFKTFAEAKDWAADTARLGQHTFYVSERGDIEGCSHPDGLAHLELDIQAAETAQERAVERAASYTEEALF